MNTPQFSQLNIQPHLLNNLLSLGFTSMTPIQHQSLPSILDKKDVIAQGKTGSGKTVAFGIGILENINTAKANVQALVLCPTRELADQVATELRKLARTTANTKVLTLCGGLPFKPQAISLAYGAHIVVGTPGRIEDHLRRQTLKLNTLSILVLDEADRMLDMGFQSAIDNILSQAPSQRQTLLLSATFPDKIEAIAKRMLSNPVRVLVESTLESSDIEQFFYQVASHETRLQALRSLLLYHQPESCVVFCNTKAQAQHVTDTLFEEGFSCLDLTGDLEQRERDQTLVQLTNKSISILVATDVAARGLDIADLDVVINFELAQDVESHIHRIGRTGRAGSKGIAATIFTAKEGFRINQLEDYLGITIHEQPLPDVAVLSNKPKQATMKTLQISGGKKQKLRPGDILGALTGEAGLSATDVGKIQISDNWSYVAVSRSKVKQAIDKLIAGKLKGKSFQVRLIGH